MIVVLGSFDGFHRGHALLFRHAEELAAERGLEWGAVTFDPHPGLFLKELPTMLFTFWERELIRLFLGIPRVVSLKFDNSLAHLSPLEFWSFLRGSVRIDGIVVGRDFRFGYRRTGDVALLEEYCRDARVPFAALDAVEYRGERISSSKIRSYIESGHCDLAAAELGHPWFILAKVVHGQGRGRKMGFPTANLNIPREKLIPKDGVYAAAVLVNEGGKQTWKAGALSVGRNPTFGDVRDVRAEVFVLDFHGDLYGDRLPVFLLSYLRHQERFDDVGQLLLQMQADVDRSRSVASRALETENGWKDGFAGAFGILIKTFGRELPER